MNLITAIGFKDEQLAPKAELLAKQLNLTVNNHTLPRLCVMPDKLALLMEGFSPLFVDFNSPMLKRRTESAKKQGIIRACKPAPNVQILDTTAGWGRDAALLAAFGANVLMLERDPMMAALLSDGLERMQLSNLTLRHQDARAYLQTLHPADYPDVIYIDPMHPERQKAALVKKDMQALQQLIGTDSDAMELLQLALPRSSQRVVVKWPQRSKPLITPNFSINGKTIRFDVYLVALGRP